MMFLKNLLDSIRKITTDDEKNAWRTAAALGVGEALNKAGDKVYGAFVQGVKNTENYLKQKSFDENTIDEPKFIESTVKKSLAQTLPTETPWVKAQEDAAEALQPMTNRTYQSAPLADYIKARNLDDYNKNEYTTTKYLDQTPDMKTAQLQKTLNSFGIKDNFGDKLKEDGLYGPKTLQAADNLIKLQNNIKGKSAQTSNNQMSPTQTDPNKTADDTADLQQKQIVPPDKDILEHFVRGSSKKEDELKNGSKYSFNPPNQYTAETELNKILDKQYPISAPPENISSSEELILPGIADIRMSKALKAIETHSGTIKAVSERFNIPKEIIGSIILKEQYTQSIPDWLAVPTSEIGSKHPELRENLSKVFGEHSTGYGAIFSTTARPAWVDYLGKEAADELLPDSDIELQKLLAYSPEFNITTIAVVLSKKAKELGLIDSPDELKNLDMKSWQKVISAYNGGSIKYGNYVMEYLPYMKTILDNTSNSW